MAKAAAEQFFDYHFFGDGREEEYDLDLIREVTSDCNTLRHKPRLSDEEKD